MYVLWEGFSRVTWESLGYQSLVNNNRVHHIEYLTTLVRLTFDSFKSSKTIGLKVHKNLFICKHIKCCTIKTWKSKKNKLLAHKAWIHRWKFRINWVKRQKNEEVLTELPKAIENKKKDRMKVIERKAESKNNKGRPWLKFITQTMENI